MTRIEAESTLNDIKCVLVVEIYFKKFKFAKFILYASLKPFYGIKKTEFSEKLLEKRPQKLKNNRFPIRF